MGTMPLDMGGRPAHRRSQREVGGNIGWVGNDLNGTVKGTCAG